LIYGNTIEPLENKPLDPAEPACVRIAGKSPNSIKCRVHLRKYQNRGRDKNDEPHRPRGGRAIAHRPQ